MQTRCGDTLATAIVSDIWSNRADERLWASLSFCNVSGAAPECDTLLSSQVSRIFFVLSSDLWSQMSNG